MAEGRTIATRGTAAMAALGLAASLIAGTAAWAQKPPPESGEAPPADEGPGPSAEGAGQLLIDAVELCGRTSVEGLDSGNAALTEAAWTIDFFGPTGPYLTELSASREYPSADPEIVDYAYFYAVTEFYASATIGYCSYEVDVPSGAIDLAAVAEAYDIEGDVRTEDDGVYGMWEPVDDGQPYYVTAYVTEDLFHFQVTWIESSGLGE